MAVSSSSSALPAAAFGICCCCCVYLGALACYRLYLSPLARFPGPKLAAATFWVEFYHDVVRRGQYTFEIAKMHDTYGPIVRITPDQLHINDADYVEHVYPGAQKPTDKHAWAASVFANPTSIISTVPHKLHRLRRAPMDPFFAKRTVAEQAASIQTAVDRLCTRFQEFAASREPLSLRIAFAALTIDVVSRYSYGESYGCLAKPDFEPGLYRAVASGGELGLLLKQYPWVFGVAMAMPHWLIRRIHPPAMDMIRRREDLETQARAVIAAKSKTAPSDTKHSTVFHSLVNSDIPESERSLTRLVDEGVTLIGAGTVTTAHVLATTSYFVLANPSILQSLQQELQAAIPDPSHAPASLATLERLPYLSAVIKEGLRLTNAITHRNPRVAPDRALRYKQWSIPAGTPIGMTQYMLHLDPAVFPQPREFRPRRWLAGEDGGGGEQLEKRFLPFGKGTRLCLGMHLAYAELYLTLGAVFRRFEMRLFETSRRDVEIAHDFIAGAPALDSKGVRVEVVSERG